MPRVCEHHEPEISTLNLMHSTSIVLALPQWTRTFVLEATTPGGKCSHHEYNSEARCSNGVTGRTEALEIFMPNSSEIILLCNACVRHTLFAEAHVYCCCTVLSHPHATATGGRTSTGSDHTICSGVDALDSHPAGLAAEVVNSKRSTQRSATRCVAKEAGASRGSENMKCCERQV